MDGTPLRSRREILKGRILSPPPPEAQISSLVVHVRPSDLQAFRESLALIPGAELHAEQGGKAVVTLETDSDSDLVTRLNEISLFEGVLSATLVYHHAEATMPPPPSSQEQP